MPHPEKPPLEIRTNERTGTIISTSLLSFKSANEIMKTPRLGIIGKVRQNEADPESDIVVCSLAGVNVLLNQHGKKKGRPTGNPEF